MVPVRHINRYLNGGCLAFAVALKREFDLSIYALVDRYGEREDWPHIFAASEEGKFAVDVRGVCPLEVQAIADGAHVGNDIDIRPVSIKEAQYKLDRYPTAKEIHEARGLVRQFLSHEVKQAFSRAPEVGDNTMYLGTNGRQVGQPCRIAW